MLEEWKALVAVTLIPPTSIVPPFWIGMAFSIPCLCRYEKISKLETVAAPVCPARDSTSEKWSKWPWVIKMVSSSPTCFMSSGVWGFSVRKGSMMICPPPAVTNLNVACPRKVILAPPSICSTILLPTLTYHDPRKNNQMYTHLTYRRNGRHQRIILRASCGRPDRGPALRPRISGGTSEIYPYPRSTCGRVRGRPDQPHWGGPANARTPGLGRDLGSYDRRVRALDLVRGGETGVHRPRGRLRGGLRRPRGRDSRLHLRRGRTGRCGARSIARYSRTADRRPRARHPWDLRCRGRFQRPEGARSPPDHRRGRTGRWLLEHFGTLRPCGLRFSARFGP